MSEYLVVYEQADDGGWGAYLPDLPGVIAGAATRDEVERLIQEAVVLHLEEAGSESELPRPASTAGTITI
jgi:predicted RNase H-like HicB family nuclease